ncbi:MAG: PEP-CTERM sorting domain-containing protein [Gemmatimonadaceae bacterium]
MRRVSLVLAVAIATVGSAMPALAQARAPIGTAATCGALSGVMFGSPTNSADKTQVVCADGSAGVQLDLAAVGRHDSPQPVEVSPGVYNVMTGFSGPGHSLWNFNFAVTGSADAFAGHTFRLLIDQDPTENASIFATIVLNPADIDPDTQLTYQNFENYGFAFAHADFVFDPAAPGEYTIQLLELTEDRVISTASINVVVASPEPGSIALVATGFAGLVGFVRRRKQGVVAAA